jgi:cellulose biosynthesis protein BcsQ
MKILAVMSGKGGVGKSTISLNIARQLTIAKKRVLLVDFDIHNKGISGLFLDLVRPESTNVNVIVSESRRFSLDSVDDLVRRANVVSVTADGLMLFIPALFPKEAFEWKNFSSPNGLMVDFFRTYFAETAKKLDVNVVLIDCYGGVDSLTVAAAGIADDVIIINEPDLITFTGTLLLYDYFKHIYPDEGQIRVHFVINRITLKHSFHFLSSEYRKHLAPLTPEKSMLAYFPFDQHVMDTFGEHPFYSELMPSGIFTKKIRLLIERLWSADAQYARFSKLSKRRTDKVFMQTSELRYAQPDRIIVAIVSLPGWLVIPSLMLVALGTGIGHSLPYDVIQMTIYTACSAIFFLVLLIGVIEPFLMSWWLLREARFQRRRMVLGPTGQMKSVLPFAGRLIAALLPVSFGILLIWAIGFLFVDVHSKLWNSSGRLVELSIWPGEIHEFRPGDNYSNLDLNVHATIGPNQNMSGAKFVSAALDGLQFRHINFKRADFSGASLDATQFIDCDLTDAQFKGASMQGTEFSGKLLKASNGSFQEAIMSLSPESVQALAHAGATKIYDQAQVITPARFVSQTKGLPEIRSELSSMNEHALGTQSSALGDMIEIDIISGSAQDMIRAQNELNELGRIADISGDEHYRGLDRLLSLLLKVRSGKPDAAQADAWAAWLEKHGQLDQWSWARWEQNLPIARITAQQKKKFKLIEESAKGSITAAQFRDSYSTD